MDKLLVNFGVEILKIVPAVYPPKWMLAFRSTTKNTIDKALRLIDLYKQAGVNKDRVLIKIASTWEGIQALMQTLEKEHGIHCNLTLLFSFPQAVACAEAGVTLISPFVGRILDWYKKSDPGKNFDKQNDPGVQSVTKIYHYYKQHNYSTIVMGASFRNTDEIKELAGCDFLTISPKLLAELAQDTSSIDRKLDKAPSTIEKVSFFTDENAFRWGFNQDPMAVDKLAEGIRNFATDGQKLLDMLKAKVAH